ncbi:MAG: hypothetical protein QM820_24380 [Minicystis sp.]
MTGAAAFCSWFQYCQVISSAATSSTSARPGFGARPPRSSTTMACSASRKRRISSGASTAWMRSATRALSTGSSWFAFQRATSGSSSSRSMVGLSVTPTDASSAFCAAAMRASRGPSVSSHASRKPRCCCRTSSAGIAKPSRSRAVASKTRT